MHSGCFRPQEAGDLPAAAARPDRQPLGAGEGPGIRHLHVAEGFRRPADVLTAAGHFPAEGDAHHGLAGFGPEGEAVPALIHVHGGRGAQHAACVLGALQADGGDELLCPEHFIGEGVVAQRSVGEGRELAAAVLLAQGHQVSLAHKGLAAGVDVPMHPQLLALRDAGVNLVKGQVQLVAVFCGPAAGAVQAAAVLLPALLLHGPADDVGAAEEGGLERLAVRLGENVHYRLAHVVVRSLDDPADGVALGLEAVGAGARQLVHPGHQPGGVLLGVLLQIAERSFQRGFLDLLSQSHTSFSLA